MTGSMKDIGEENDKKGASSIHSRIDIELIHIYHHAIQELATVEPLLKDNPEIRTPLY